MNHLCLIKFVLFSSILLFSASCRQQGTEEKDKRLSANQLVEINRELVIKEKERIESYISRKGLDMQMSDAGIWYSLTEKGKGDVLLAGDRISLEYSCSLLDGTLCYSSEKDGRMNITVGKSNIPGGLDEALRLLRDNSEAIIILPSNRAYGLVGDNNKIPARAALIYTLKVYRR